MRYGENLAMLGLESGLRVTSLGHKEKQGLFCILFHYSLEIFNPYAGGG